MLMFHHEALVQTTTSDFSHGQVNFNLCVALANTSSISLYAGLTWGVNSVEASSISSTASSSSQLEDISNRLSAGSEEPAEHASRLSGLLELA